MLPLESTLLTGPAGTLETRLETPEAAPRFVGLVCHPHPLYGGTLNNKVVTTLSRIARRQQGAVLQFNFRGVGQSEGQHDGGLGEADDAVWLVNWLKAHYPGLPFWLAGFSFGAMVAARAAAQLAANGTPADRLLLVAPPVERYVWPALSECVSPVTIIQGDDDEVVDSQAVQHWAEKQNAKNAIIRVADCSHFFHGRLNELAQAAATSLP